MIVLMLEKIQDPEWKAFGFRVYNTFKSIILPVVLPLIYIQLQSNSDILCLLEETFLMSVLYAVAIALTGSAIAGLEKVNRMKEEQ